MARLTSSSEAQLEALREIRSLLGIISGKLDAIADRPAPAPAAAVTTTNGNGEAANDSYKDFDAEAITMGQDDNGRVVYKVKGGQYGKFGVRVWPEVLPLLGVDIDGYTGAECIHRARAGAAGRDRVSEEGRWASQVEW